MTHHVPHEVDLRQEGVIHVLDTKEAVQPVLHSLVVVVQLVMEVVVLV